jgi:hypothetical protein
VFNDYHVEMPVVVFEGCSNAADGSKLSVEWVHHYEIVVQQGTHPMAVPLETVTEHDFDRILQLVDTYPMSAAGHSFKDVIRSIMRGLNKTVRFVQENKDTISTLYGAASTLLSFI